MRKEMSMDLCVHRLGIEIETHSERGNIGGLVHGLGHQESNMNKHMIRMFILCVFEVNQ